MTSRHGVGCAYGSSHEMATAAPYAMRSWVVWVQHASTTYAPSRVHQAEHSTLPTYARYARHAMHMGTVNVDQDARVHEKNDFVMASMNMETHAIQSINGMLDPGGRSISGPRAVT